MAAVLSTAERQRMARFVKAELRARYAVRRGALRHILGRGLGLPPARIEFVTSHTGKPALAAGRVTRSLHFSVSHSGNIALVAVSDGDRLGVDVERRRTVPNLALFAKDVLSPAERAEIDGLGEPEYTWTFLELWTRKEAYLKAIGEGLSVPLYQVVCSVPPAPARMLEIPDSLAHSAHWSMTALTVPDALGTLAFEGLPPVVEWRPWRFPGDA